MELPSRNRFALRLNVPLQFQYIGHGAREASSRRVVLLGAFEHWTEAGDQRVTLTCRDAAGSDTKPKSFLVHRITAMLDRSTGEVCEDVGGFLSEVMTEHGQGQPSRWPSHRDQRLRVATALVFGSDDYLLGWAFRVHAAHRPALDILFEGRGKLGAWTVGEPPYYGFADGDVLHHSSEALTIQVFDAVPDSLSADGRAPGYVTFGVYDTAGPSPQFLGLGSAPQGAFAALLQLGIPDGGGWYLPIAERPDYLNIKQFSERFVPFPGAVAIVSSDGASTGPSVNQRPSQKNREGGCYLVRYLDSNGALTEREISSIKPHHSNSITGTCRLRGEARTFLFFRMVYIADAITGEVVEDPWAEFGMPPVDGDAAALERRVWPIRWSVRALKLFAYQTRGIRSREVDCLVEFIKGGVDCNGIADALINDWVQSLWAGSYRDKAECAQIAALVPSRQRPGCRRAATKLMTGSGRRPPQDDWVKGLQWWFADRDDESGG